MHRRDFVRNGGFAGLSLSLLFSRQVYQSPRAFALDEITIDELQQKMASGELTSRKITEMYLKRILEVDKQGPNLNSVIELNPDAVAIASELDKERKAGKIR